MFHSPNQTSIERLLSSTFSRKSLPALALILALTAPSAALAIAPVNDSCANAIMVPSNGPWPFISAPIDITDATTAGDPGAPGCQSLVARSIWYSFTPDNTDFFTISSCSDLTTVSDTVLAIYTNPVGCSDPGSFMPFACADDSAGTCLRKASVSTQLEGGTRYYIVVWQYAPSQITPGNANVQVYVSKAAAPSNETCNTAQPLQVNIPAFGSTFAAQNDYELPDTACFNGPGQIPSTASGRDVVYSFSAPAAGRYSIKVSNYSPDPNELVLYVAGSCPADGAPAVVTDCLQAANRVIYGTAEDISCLALAQNQQIYIFVDEDFETAGSTFTVEVTRCQGESEPNNTPALADPLPLEVQGSLPVRGDEDYFSLGTFPAGSRAFALVDGSAGTTTAFYIDVRTATNILEVDKGDASDIFGTQSGSIAGTVLPPVPTYLRVHNYTLRQITEPYRLYAVVQPPIENASLELEPNDLYHEANSSPGGYFRGTLSSPTDVDHYTVNLAAGDLVFVSLDSDPSRDNTPIDAKLELLDADGKALVAVDDPNSISETNTFEPTSPSEGLVYRVPEDGTFIVMVTISPDATGPVASGDYLLSISKNCFAGESGTDTAPAITATLNSSVGSSEVNLHAQIADPDTGEVFTALVNWGDSTTTLLTNMVGVYSLNLNHSYAQNGNKTVTLSVSDFSGLVASTNFQFNLVNVVQPRLVMNRGASFLTLRLEGTPTATYRIQSTSDLITWEPFTSLTISASGFAEIDLTDIGVPPGYKFYRAVFP